MPKNVRAAKRSIQRKTRIVQRQLTSDLKFNFENHFGNWSQKMGNVFSGKDRSRRGRVAVDTLPTVRITHADLYDLNRQHRPYLRIEGPGWATVISGRHSWPVHLDHTPLHLGGHRRWLLCPSCGDRRAALYIAADNLVCRHCLGGRYESQHENRRYRWIRKARKLRAKLGWSPGVLDPAGFRPKGMHANTYRRLCGELVVLTNAIFASMNSWAAAAHEALDRRHPARTNLISKQ